MRKMITNMGTNMHVNTFPSGTWNCIPSTDRTTVYSDSATEFMSRFPFDIPREATQALTQCNHENRHEV